MSRVPIEFACGFSTLQSTYVRPRRHSYLYREAIAEATHAEDLGFDSVWVGSHHFSYDGYCPSPLLALAHIAAATKRIAVGVGVLQFALHTPAEVACQLEAFHNALPGRTLRLGVASGYVVREFLAHRVEFRARGKALDEHLHDLLFKHSQQFGDTELWVGGTASRAFQRAARNGASLILGPQFSADQIRAIRRDWESALVPRMGQTPRIIVLREVWPHEDPLMRNYYYHRLREQYKGYELFAEPGENIQDKPAFQVEDAESKSFVDTAASMALVGSTDKIVEELGRVIQAGADGIVFRVRVDGVPHGQVIWNLERLASSVIPQLRRV